MTPSDGPAGAAAAISARDQLIETNIQPFPVLAGPLPLPLKRRLMRGLEVISLLAVDLLALVAAFLLAYMVRVALLPNLLDSFPPVLPPHIWERLWWLPLVVFGCLIYEGLYTKRHSFWRECGQLIKAATMAFIVALAMVTLAKTGGEVSRTLIVLSWFFSMLLLPAFRYTGKTALAHAGVWCRRVLVLGVGRTGELVVQALNRDTYMGYQVAGILEDDPKKKNKVLIVNGGTRVRVLGGFRDSDRVMAAAGVSNLIVAAPGLQGPVLVGLVNRLQRVCESVLVVPDLFGLPVVGVETTYFLNDQTLILQIGNNLASKWNIFIKRVFDLVIGLIILAIILPILIIFTVLIKLDSKGSALFIQKRLGRDGKVFSCLKFRTMVQDAEEVLKRSLEKDPEMKKEWEANFKLKNDPRITRVGKLLRKTSVDELPQIISVLMGEMSLVGPRPRPLYELNGRKNNYLFNVGLSVRPGMTGLWQVSGRNELDFGDRIKLDAVYVRNWSLWIDVSLLFRTISVVLWQKGAY